jgi:hypothetical protein
MRRYKVVACILLILSVFGFVLAAPVAVQEVREARADGAVDGSENVIIGSGKRADSEEEPLLQSWAQTQEESSSYWSSTPWKHQGTSSTPNYASGTHPNPSFSSGDSKPPPLSTSGGTEVTSNPLAEGEANLIQPVTSTEIQPASLSKSKSVSWVPPKVSLPSGDIHTETLQPEIQPASLSKSKSVSWGPTTEIKPLPLSPEREGYQPKMAAQQSPSPPKRPSKNIFRKLVGKLKLKFSRRISGTAGEGFARYD